VPMKKIFKISSLLFPLIVLVVVVLLFVPAVDIPNEEENQKIREERDSLIASRDEVKREYKEFVEKRDTVNKEIKAGQEKTETWTKESKELLNNIDKLTEKKTGLEKEIQEKRNKLCPEIPVLKKKLVEAGKSIVKAGKTIEGKDKSIKEQDGLLNDANGMILKQDGLLDKHEKLELDMMNYYDKLVDYWRREARGIRLSVGVGLFGGKCIAVNGEADYVIGGGLIFGWSKHIKFRKKRISVFNILKKYRELKRRR
jgi:chromosome segregation ATPase